jgi:hypothetical protein
MGELGLRRNEFDEMSWEDYCYAAHGYFVRQAREREPLRFIAAILFNSNVDKKDRLSPEKLMPLFTDKPRKVNETHKEIQKQKAKLQLDKLNNGRSVTG